MSTLFRPRKGSRMMTGAISVEPSLAAEIQARVDEANTLATRPGEPVPKKGAEVLRGLIRKGLEATKGGEGE